MTSKSIVVVGSCMIDFVSYAPRLPTAGETIHGNEFATNFGGKGANQCVAAAKLGGNTTLIARVGDDTWGPNYVEHLKTVNVNTDYVQTTSNTTTGIAQITVSEAGENQIVIVAGANTSLNITDVDAAEQVIKNAAVVVVQLETSIHVAIRAIKLSQGITILNGAPALYEYDTQILSLPTIFCVNESEASIFTGGLPVHDVSEAQIAAYDLINKGCNSVLITLGRQGALFLDKNGQFCHVPCPAVKCVDSTGAGDAFIGALAFLLAKYGREEARMEDIIKMACRAASDSVTRQGTQISFPGPSIFDSCT